MHPSFVTFAMFSLFLTASVYGQAPQKMSPEQQQLIDKARAKAAAMQESLGRSIDIPSLNPLDVKPPKLDVKRLAQIPVQPPSNEALRMGLAKMKQNLGAKFSNPQQIVQKFSAANNHDPDLLQAAAVGVFYKTRDEETGEVGDPVIALLLSIESAEKQEQILAKSEGGPEVEVRPQLIKAVNNLNNLSAMLNMTGLHDKAIPLLNKCLQRMPKHSLALNNIGQAYLALGDLKQARQFLTQCLSIDDLNPEANHSMGMISLFEHMPEAALKFFNKELEIAMRARSLERYAALGKEQALSLLRNSKAKEGRDYFEEVNLGEFAARFPNLPTRMQQINLAKDTFYAYGEWGLAEFMNWWTRQIPIDEVIAEGKRTAPFRDRIINILIEDLQKEFTHDYLAVLSKKELEELDAIDQYYSTKLRQIVCPEPPKDIDPLKVDRIALAAAYDVKCCTDFKGPLFNEWLEMHNSYVAPKVKRAAGRWKTYLNQLIYFANLAPSGANKLTVYKAVGLYYSTISAAKVMIDNPPPPLECGVRMNLDKADLIIAESKLNFDCPPSFYIHAPLKVIDLKLTCDKIEVEASLGVFVLTGTQEIKSKRSTVAFGTNVEANFFEVAKAGVKHQVYVTMEADGSVADVGLKQELGAEIMFVGKIDGGSTIGVITGFQEQKFTGVGGFAGAENKIGEAFKDVFVIPSK